MRIWKLTKEILDDSVGSSMCHVLSRTLSVMGRTGKEFSVRESPEADSAKPDIRGVTQFGNFCCSSEGTLSALRVCAYLLAKLGGSSRFVRTVASSVCILFQRFR